MARLMFEIVLAVTISVGIYLLTAISMQNYLIIGLVVAGVALALIYATKGFVNNDENAPTFVWLLVTALICGLLGAVWPSVPVILGMQRAVRKPSTDEIKDDEKTSDVTQ